MADELVAAYNEQVTLELASSVAYLQMAAHFESSNLVGMAGWMRAQAAEEAAHADRFIAFILDRGADVKIGNIPAPTTDFGAPEAVFEASLNQERAVTKSIHDLFRLARKNDDLASEPFLSSFIDEQIEEESTVESILERVRLAGGESSALLLLDSELGARTAPA
ncbi:MAG: ferritin [Acidimicrobiia bacterium]